MMRELTVKVSDNQFDMPVNFFENIALCSTAFLIEKKGK